MISNGQHAYQPPGNNWRITMTDFNEVKSGTTDTTSISQITQHIRNRKVLLPALQRKFVWTDDQIITLFDSIMKSYPIGTLIFWDLETQTAVNNQYTFYEFISDFSERSDDPGYLNQRMPQNFTQYADPKLFIVLDGQQRITAIYTALQGSITRKKPYRKEYIKRELYFNLKTKLYLPTASNAPQATTSDDGDAQASQTAFAFWSREEVQRLEEINDSDPNKPIWFKVKDILNYHTIPDIGDYLQSKNLLSDQFIYKNMVLLMNKIHNEQIFNIYIYKTDDIDCVQDIFVRVNSGGTKLCKTDLLFSAIVSKWENAREEFDALRKEIIREHRVDINTDFMMRTCLYLIDLPTKLSLSSFTADKVHEFEANWDNMRGAILYVFELFKRIGIDINLLPSKNSIIPIIYHYYKSNSDETTCKNLNNIRLYVASANIENLFGRSQDTLLAQIRTSLKENLKKSSQFPHPQNITHNGEPMISLDSKAIESWLDYPKEDTRTLFVLNLLYPDYNYKAISVNIDHMHPLQAIKDLKEQDLVDFPGLQPIHNYESLTTKERKALLKQRKEALKYVCNSLPNLQILTEEDNKRKSDTPLSEWLQTHSNIPYLPKTDYNLRNIINFTIKRKALIHKTLCQMLHV